MRDLLNGYVRLKVDTKNGKAPICETFHLNRNAVYILVLDPLGREKARLLLGSKATEKDVVGLLKNQAPETGAQGVDLLLRLLGDADGVLRRDAARSLGRLGSRAREAVPQLAARLKDRWGGPSIAFEAAMALKRMGPDAREALPALIAVLQEETAGVSLRQQAAFAMVAADPTGKDVLPVLIDALASTEGFVRYGVVAALGQLGSAAKPAEQALREALPGSQDPTAKRIRALLRRLGR